MKHTPMDDEASHGLLPIDLPCQRDLWAGAELEHFLQMRWRMTADLLRSELRNGETIRRE